MKVAGVARARARVCVCVFGVINYFVTYWEEVSKKISGETGVGVGVVKTLVTQTKMYSTAPCPFTHLIINDSSLDGPWGMNNGPDSVCSNEDADKLAHRCSVTPLSTASELH